MLDLLDGVRVVSFNHFLLGPVGMQILGDLGAEVIAVEPIEGAFQRGFAGAGTWVDGQSALQLCGNRNKKSLAVDLKSKEGREVVGRLVERADVVCENFRPGVMEKLGLGCETLRAANPSLIYAAASGFGPDGPYASRPGQDMLIQAMSGLAKITGEAATGPRTVGVSAADHHGAALLALGIVAALVRRGRTGQGCRVDVNLLSAAIDLQMESFVCYLNATRKHDVTAPHRLGGWYYTAPYGIYPVQDGHVAISITTMAALGKALESPELAAIPEAATVERSDEIVAILNRVLPTRSFADWQPRLEAEKIWHTRVNDYDDVRNDPQVRHNQTFVTVEGATGAAITVVNHAIRYDGEAASVGLPPQQLGAQTREILAELGYDAQAIEALLAAGAVRAAEG
jgi:crotonobetainyl-CoA:carnitine CoA-transferase CaiB-like acyl-CoA transferase